MNQLTKKALRGMIAGALACAATGMTVQAASLPSSSTQESGFTSQNDCAFRGACAGLSFGCKSMADCNATPHECATYADFKTTK